MLDLKNFSVTYPDKTQAIENVSLHIETGEHLALVGGNGAGKTTLLLALAGIVDADGAAYFDDIKLTKENIGAIRKKLGVVLQNPDDQLFMASIYDDIAFGPRNLGLDEMTVRRRVEDRLKLLNIEHLRDKTALKLSGGEKRMAALASVLAMKPDIMLFDEPTAFLDPKARRTLINVLQKLPHTMLIATHDLTFAEAVCKRTVILKKGKIFAAGASKELLYNEGLMESGGIEAIGVY